MRRTAESACQRLLLFTFVSALALTAGCGDGNVLQSPTGPSSTLSSNTILTGDANDVVATASSSGEAAMSAKGDDGNNGKSGSDKKPADNDGPGRSHEDRVVGFVSAKSGDTLTVRGVAVVAAPDAVIRHGNRTLTIADIEVGDHVQARGTMDGTTLVAVEIKVEDTGNDDEDVDEAEVEGTISNLSSTGNCPVVTFMIGTTKVTTSATTTFDDVTCSNLANNARVEVEGTRQTDGSILATRVEAEAGPDEVVGTVFEFSGSGSCPTASFKVGPTLNLATKVTTTASTSFSGVTCAALANGTQVEVEGTKQGDGSITAASVELK